MDVLFLDLFYLNKAEGEGDTCSEEGDKEGESGGGEGGRERGEWRTEERWSLGAGGRGEAFGSEGG